MVLNDTEMQLLWLWYDVQAPVNCTWSVFWAYWVKTCTFPLRPRLRSEWWALPCSGRSVCYTPAASALCPPTPRSARRNPPTERRFQIRANVCMIYCTLLQRLMNRSHLLQHLVCAHDVVRIRLESGQLSRRIHLHVLREHAVTHNTEETSYSGLQTSPF